MSKVSKIVKDDSTITYKIARHVAAIRIIFGLFWLINASLKWKSSYSLNLSAQLQGAVSNQPGWTHAWFNIWVNLTSNNAKQVAILVALSQTLIALFLIFGFARKLTYYLAVIFSLLVWTIVEGFNGPYLAASNDFGAGIIYTIIFISIYGLDRLSEPPMWSVDNYLNRKISWWHKLSVL